MQERWLKMLKATAIPSIDVEELLDDKKPKYPSFWPEYSQSSYMDAFER